MTTASSNLSFFLPQIVVFLEEVKNTEDDRNDDHQTHKMQTKGNMLADEQQWRQRDGLEAEG